MLFFILIMQEYILKTIKKYILYFSIPYVITKSYPERIEDWIANAPKKAVNVGDKFELEIFRPTVANKSDLEVCLYFFVQ